MTTEDILRMAREAWGDSDPSVDSPAWRYNMVQFAALVAVAVAAAEREACAKVCDELASNDAGDSSEAMRHCAAAIRERNKE